MHHIGSFDLHGYRAHQRNGLHVHCRSHERGRHIRTVRAKRCRHSGWSPPRTPSCAGEGCHDQLHPWGGSRQSHCPERVPIQDRAAVVQVGESRAKSQRRRQAVHFPKPCFGADPVSQPDREWKFRESRSHVSKARLTVPVTGIGMPPFTTGAAQARQPLVTCRHDTSFGAEPFTRECESPRRPKDSMVTAPPVEGVLRFRSIFGVGDGEFVSIVG